MVLPLIRNQVQAQFPKVKPTAKSPDWRDGRAMRAFYGDALRGLTIPMARALLGVKLVGISGQPSTEGGNRMKVVQNMMIIDAYSVAAGDDVIKMRIDGAPMWSSNEDGEETMWVTMDFAGFAITGGGGDPVYVFVTGS